MAIIKIHGILVDMLPYIAPDFYGPYLTTDRKGIKQMINQCMNAIYATMVTSPLFYCKFFYTLKLNKFKMNTSDPCADNQMLNGLQQSILLYVDNIKLSHKDNKVNDIFV